MTEESLYHANYPLPVDIQMKFISNPHFDSHGNEIQFTMLMIISTPTKCLANIPNKPHR
jgi:hypothetical protein